MLFRWAIHYTVFMYSQIERQMRLQRWLNQSVRGLFWGGMLLMVALLILRRVVGVEATWLVFLLPLVPVITTVLVWRQSIHSNDVLRYAEYSSGDTGLLLFDHAVESKEWKQRVETVWSTVQPPSLKAPDLSAVTLLVCVLSVAMLWVPLRTIHSDNHYPTIVEQELTQIQEQIDSMEALLEPDSIDPEVEAWKDSVDQIEEGMSIGSTLRELEQLSEQIEQRQQSALESVEEAMQALQQGDQQALQTATEQLQSQNMLPKSADGTESGQSSEGATENAKQDGQETENGSIQTGQSTTASPSQQQLQQQLQNLQQQLQQMQSQSNPSSSNSGQQGASQNGSPQGIQSFSNEALQQMSQQSPSSSGPQGHAGQSGQQNGQAGEGGENQADQGASTQGQSSQTQADQGQQNGSGQQGSPQNGQSEGGQGEGQGQGQEGSNSMDLSNASPSSGGGTAPLTYEEGSLIPNQNLRALDGVPQVDWENSVQFSTVPTPFGDVQTVPISTSGNVQPTTSSVAGQSQVAPQHRQVVEDFFAVDQAQ